MSIQEEDHNTTYTSDPMLTSTSTHDETYSEEQLRPHTLNSFIGQPILKKQIDLFITAAQKRQSSPDHILFAGPPGLGKTTLALIISQELNVPIRVTSGPAIQHPGDLASILSSLGEGEVLFIDEIHRLPRAAEEMLYIAMEDFRVDVIVGKGPGASSIPLELPRFTVIGATTREGMLPAPLRARFGFTAHLDYYDLTELSHVVERSATVLNITTTTNAALAIAKCSRGTPRIANRILRRVRDLATVRGVEVIHEDLVAETLELYQIDSAGLDYLDLSVLQVIHTNFHDGPVGIKNLAAVVGEEVETIETVCEPYLVRSGFLIRTPRGRVITEKAQKHLEEIAMSSVS